DVAEPRVYLTIAADGRTNIPEPKVKRKNPRTAMETILDVAIDRVRMHEGSFEIEERSRTPLDFEGRNLAVQLAYNTAGPRYQGTLAVTPLNVRYDGYTLPPFTSNLAITLERNRISIDSGRMTAGAVAVDLSGALEDLTAPHASFRYNARAPVS